MNFNLICSDPPWNYNNRVDHKDTPRNNTRFGGGAQAHYDLMKDQDLIDMGPLVHKVSANNCLLALWTTGPKLPVSLDVMRAWGFQYCTVGFVWIKIGGKSEPTTSPGYYTASNAEFVLFGKRGRTPFALKPARRLLNSVVFAPRMKHSAKPEKVQDRLDLMYPAFNKLEMFARRQREGWSCTGLDLDGKDIREALQEYVLL